MSSNPSYRPAQRVVPISYAGYRTCIECDLAFYPEVGTQMMCRLCQVGLSYRRVGEMLTVACGICGQEFETPRSSPAKFCSDACRDERKLKRKAETRARMERAKPAPKSCERCGELLIDSAPHAKRCVPCRRAVKAERNREAWAKKRIGTREPRPCVICGDTFTPATYKSMHCAKRSCKYKYFDTKESA